MELRCRLKGAKCPPYEHEGVFEATNKTLIHFESDLERCAKCTAFASPALAHFQEDLLQIARITLFRKGPAFDPNHPKKASFRTYILPWICGALTREKEKERRHYFWLTPVSEQEDSSQDGSEAADTHQHRIISGFPDKEAEFVDTLIWEMWIADFELALPELLHCLTKREKQVFKLTRADMEQIDIAKRLGLTRSRICQILKQVERKLRRECRKRGLVE